MSPNLSPKQTKTLAKLLRLMPDPPLLGKGLIRSLVIVLAAWKPRGKDTERNRNREKEIDTGDRMMETKAPGTGDQRWEWEHGEGIVGKRSDPSNDSLESRPGAVAHTCYPSYSGG